MTVTRKPVLYTALVVIIAFSVGLLHPANAADGGIVVVKPLIPKKVIRRLATKRRLRLEVATRNNADTAETLARQAADSAESAVRLATDNALAAQINASIHSIGETFGGGYVFFVYDGGRHGLIVSGIDLAAATSNGSIIRDFRWGGFTTGPNPQPFISNAIADGLGAGKANTAFSISAQIANNDTTVTTPALLCHFHRVTQSKDGLTYSEWYLPSKYELNLLYQNRNSIPGGFGSATYWSSTEFWDPTQPLGILPSAWSQSFANGTQTASLKTETFRARAIRSF